MNNAADPDPRSDLSADIAYDGSDTNNCIARNVFTTDDPPAIVSQFPCP